MSKRALITGVNGFTGRHMAVELSLSGYEVFGIVHRPLLKLPSGVSEVHVCSLNQTMGLAEIMAEVRPDVVVHLAAVSTILCDDIDLIYQTNLLGSRRILDALCRQECGRDGVLLASSATIYGSAHAGMLTEDALPFPANDYSVSKLAMEHLARLFSDRLPIVIARPFNYTGVGQDLSFLIPKLISHARQRKITIDLGNLDVARDFSDVRSVVACYRRLLECPTARGRTFNVCSGQAHNLRQLLDMVEEISGCSFEVKTNPALVRANEVKTLLGSRERLIDAIGEVSEIPLYDTLRWMFEAAE
ncbi:NAD-dependent epimerase/dehydratase family protein [Magnetospirillum molischianum]|uniref:Putative GDP-mannose 4,6-dehydratase n=1 Tax=Magnetospirillum molischianum DSM 120 TaxID=1150626 RepID=H8FUT6_MAGML|nr:NAD-dependent epimerase/dehydratase family protein [Magnetospirillum molischianum]CCG42124.1 putative GDP-mannose 4,6-dehydratase [Magnetospirillum molischianum DSM 120]